MIKTDEYYMSLALKEAEKGRGFVKTNPLVGAVITKNGKLISKGYHKEYGKAHAEVNVIKNAKRDLKGGDIYVTLEPCSTFGKTPPCTDAIIKNKFRRVVIGTLDPNPKHNGRAVNILKENNIDVKVGVLEKECRQLIEPFITNLFEQRPYIILKLAMTLDGKIASNTGDSKWITNEFSRKKVHELRRDSDAVMIGKNTALFDNPELTVRHVETLREPDRIVFDSKLELKHNLKIFNIQSNEKVFVICDNGDSESYNNVHDKGIYIIKSGGILKNALKTLYMNFNIGTVLLEGGSMIAASLIKENLVDKFMFFLAPKIIGGNGLNSIGNMGIHFMKDSIKLNDVKYTFLEGGDLLIEGYIRRKLCLQD